MTEREPLEQGYEPAYDEARLATTWRRIAARRWPARRARKAWLLVGLGASAALLAAGALVVFGGHAEPPRPAMLAMQDATLSAAPGTVFTELDHELVLADESRIALAHAARLQILANDGTRFATVLEAGTAHFDVHPGGPRRWEIETALASVEVVGTAFTVAVSGGQLEVAVERGVVLVHGELVPGRIARLTAGQHIVVAPAPVPARAEPLLRVPASASATPVPPIVHAPVAPPAPAAAASARPGQPVATVSAATTEPVADVIADADQLTSSGDAAGAAKLLEQVRKRGTDREAGLIAFTLGRLYLDALAQPELAAAAFDEVVARGTPHGLLEDAYARRAEALIRAGLHERAATALAAYADAYPAGRRLAALRALMKASP